MRTLINARNLPLFTETICRMRCVAIAGIWNAQNTYPQSLNICIIIIRDVCHTSTTTTTTTMVTPTNGVAIRYNLLWTVACTSVMCSVCCDASSRCWRLADFGIKSCAAQPLALSYHVLVVVRRSSRLHCIIYHIEHRTTTTKLRSWILYICALCPVIIQTFAQNYARKKNTNIPVAFTQQQRHYGALCICEKNNI